MSQYKDKALANSPVQQHLRGSLPLLTSWQNFA